MSKQKQDNEIEVKTTITIRVKGVEKELTHEEAEALHRALELALHKPIHVCPGPTIIWDTPRRVHPWEVQPMWSSTRYQLETNNTAAQPLTEVGVVVY